MVSKPNDLFHFHVIYREEWNENVNSRVKDPPYGPSV